MKKKMKKLLNVYRFFLNSVDRITKRSERLSTRKNRPWETIIGIPKSLTHLCHYMPENLYNNDGTVGGFLVDEPTWRCHQNLWKENLGFKNLLSFGSHNSSLLTAVARQFFVSSSLSLLDPIKKILLAISSKKKKEKMEEEIAES